MKLLFKPILCLSFISLASLLLFSCSKEEGIVVPSDKEPVSIRFHFQMGGEEPVHYTRATPIQDSDETAIQSLQFFQFTADGSSLLQTEYIADVNSPIVGNNQDKGVVIRNGMDYVYARYFDPNDAAAYKFCFVANHAEIPQSGVSSITDLESYILAGKLKADGSSTSMDILLPYLSEQDATIKTNRYRIPMSGIAQRSGNEQVKLFDAGDIVVPMTRTVARIDIYNRVPGLEITSLRIKNSYDRATLFPSTSSASVPTYEAPSGATLCGMNSFCCIAHSKPSNTDMKNYNQWLYPFRGSKTGAETSIVKKAFYLYEGKQSSQSNEVLTLVVSGLIHSAYGYTGLDHEIEIPFVVSSASGTGTTPIHIKRNNLYEVYLNESTKQSQGVSFSIQCKAWEEGKTSEVEIPTSTIGYYGTTHYVDFTAPHQNVNFDPYGKGESWMTEKITPSETNYANYRYFYYNPKQSLAIANYAQRKFYFSLSSTFLGEVRHKVVLNEDPDHIKVLPTSWKSGEDPKIKKISPTARNMAIELNYPLTEARRKALLKIEFTFTDYPSKKLLFTFVSDPAYVNTETTETL